MSEELKERVSIVEKAVFGDRENPNDSPGIIATQMKMSLEQARTNEILLELRDSVRKISWVIIGGFVTALITAVLKGLSS